MNKLNKYMSDSYQNFFDSDLSITDPDLYNSIKQELERQQQHIELIASENIVSKAVLDAQGSIMTPNMQMFNHIQALKQMEQYILHY